MTLVTPHCRTYTPLGTGTSFWESPCDNPPPGIGFIRVPFTKAGCGMSAGNEEKCCFFDDDHTLVSDPYQPATGYTPIAVPLHTQPCGTTPPPPVE